MVEKRNVMISFNKNLLQAIDDQVHKKGIGHNRSEYINEALDHYLRVKVGFSYILKKKNE